MRQDDFKNILPALALLAISCLMPGASNATAFRVTVQTIEICDDSGANCAGKIFDEAAIDAIYAQADLDIQFLPTTQFDSTEFLEINIFLNEGIDLIGADNSVAATASRNPDPDVLNLWFVGGTVNGVGGQAILGGNGAWFLIQGELTTLNTWGIAHLLGHNLGLNHIDIASNLMTLGSLGDLLNQTQITAIQSSQFVTALSVAEPPTVMFFIVGLLFLFSITQLRKPMPVRPG